MAAIEIQNLEHRYPATKGSASSRLVFSQLQLSIEAGEIFGLLGPNGGGKTTLFRILSTSLKPTNGQATLFEKNVISEANEVRRLIGVVFQNPSLDKKLTVKENLVHQGRLYGMRRTAIESCLSDLSQKLRIDSRLNDAVETLSGGLQRRVEIAKGLLHNPQLLLLDEPSTGLDPGARRDVWEILLDLKNQGVTILLTTHLMEEADKCDRVAILHNGTIQALGTPENLKSKIGGDIITIHTSNPPDMVKKLSDTLKLNATSLDSTVRIEANEGHKLIPQLIEMFPSLIESVTVAKPTLEDVFVHETGQLFWQEQP